MSERQFKLGLLGCGAVGSGVVDLVRRNGDEIARRTGVRLEIEKILVRDPDRPRGVDRALLTDRGEDVVCNGVDVVVELLGGIEPALALVRQSLERGKPVVTANKRLLACHHRLLRSLSGRFGAPLSYEASACAGLPVIRALRSGLSGDRIRAFEGVVNGTSNFILSRIEDGATFDAAMDVARERGFVEADASADIDGHDAAEKTAILCGEAFGFTFDLADFPRDGIRGWTSADLSTAARLGYAVRLTSQAAVRPDGALDARVGPALVPRTHALARLRDEHNALVIHGEASGELTFAGKGAGGRPTAAAVVADILDLAAGCTRPCGGPWRSAGLAPPGQASWFVRVRETNVRSPVCWLERLAKAGIETRWVEVRREVDHHDSRAVSLLTQPCLESGLRGVLEQAKDHTQVVLAIVHPDTMNRR